STSLAQSSVAGRLGPAIFDLASDSLRLSQRPLGIESLQGTKPTSQSSVPASVPYCVACACGWRSTQPTFKRPIGDGMPQIGLPEQPRTNPLDVVERIAAINDWAFERAGDDEITMVVAGRWSDYQVSFTWMHDIEALHL